MAGFVKLVANFFANTSELEKGLSSASRKTRAFQKELKEISVTGTKALAGIGAAFGALTVQQSLFADQLGKNAQKYGVTVKALSELTYVADLAGIEAEGLAKSFKFMGKAILDSATGSKEQERAFKVLGLSAKELIGLKPEEAFEKIGDAIAKIENPTLKAALATAIFGKAGADLIPLFNAGSAALRQAREEAKRFGLTVYEFDTANIEKMNDAFTKVGQATAGAARQFAAGLAPSIAVVIEKFVSLVDWADKFRQFGSNIGLLVASGFTILDRVLRATKIAFDELAIKAYEARKAVGDFFKIDTSELDVKINAMKAKLSREKENLQLEIAFKKDSLQKSALEETAKAREEFAKENAKGGGSIFSGGIDAKTQSQLDMFSAKAEDTSKKIKDTLEGLRNEIELKRINISLEGKTDSEKAAAIKRAEILNTLAKEGIKLGKEKTAELDALVAKSKEYDDVLDKVNKREAERKQLQEDITSRFETAFEDAIINGKKLSTVLKSLASDMLNMLAKSALKSATGGIIDSIGGSLGGFFGSIGSSVVSSIGGLLGFAKGTDYVPRDMVANIHKGEMIIPAREAAQMRAGGGGASVVQNITIGTSVSTAVRAEVARMLPDLKRATVEAVQDSRMRGSTI